MRTFLAVVVLLITTVSFANPIGQCEIFPAKRLDATGTTYCAQDFGVAYRGYLIPYIGCVDIKIALEKIKELSSCERSIKKGECEIGFPRRLDRNNKYCKEGFGVKYQGYYIESIGCQESIDEAFKEMDAVCQ